VSVFGLLALSIFVVLAAVCGSFLCLFFVFASTPPEGLHERQRREASASRS
jgi:hypothetical protein